jgi:hypothetical protein
MKKRLPPSLPQEGGLPHLTLQNKILHILRFDREAKRLFILRGREFGGENQRFNHALLNLQSVQKILNLRDKLDARGRVEPSIVSSLVGDMERKLCPLSPRKTSVLGREIAVLTTFLYDLHVVVLDSSTNDQLRDLVNLVASMSLLGLEALGDDRREILSLAVLDDFLDDFDVHTIR